MAAREPDLTSRDTPTLLGRLEFAFVRINQALVVAMMAAMVALVFTNVVCRYLLGFSIIWAEELSQYLMVWITFLGAGLALREGRHVAVELVQDRLPKPAARIARIVVAGSVLAFLGVLTVLGAQFALFARDQETPVMTISLGIPYLAVPIGALIFALHLLLMWRNYLDKHFVAPESLEAGADEGVL